MSVSYNTNSPTPEIKNTINSINKSFNVRDFLLNRNIKNPIKYPQYSTSINGSPRIGEPVLDTSINGDNVIRQEDIAHTSKERVTNSIKPNTFKDDSSTANQLLYIEDVIKTPIFKTTTPPVGSVPYIDTIDSYGLMQKTKEMNYLEKTVSNNLYTDRNAQIDSSTNISTSTQSVNTYTNGYLSSISNNTGVKKATDILGSLLNGQGVGFDTTSDEFVTNFDFRTSITGRLLNSTGLIKDTPLGIISGKALANAIANNAIFKAERTALGTLDVQGNIMHAIKGEKFGFRPNYKITVTNSTLGKIANFGEAILGVQIPVKDLTFDNLLENTGEGQAMELFKHINLNKYRPSFTYKKDNIREDLYTAEDGSGWFGDVNKNFSWVSSASTDSSLVNFNENGHQIYAPEDSLLYKTQQIFNDKKMKTIVSSKGSSKVAISQINSAVVNAPFGEGAVSRGSNVMNEKGLGNSLNVNPEEIFCRTWNSFSPYKKVKDLIRHSGLSKEVNSVLDDTGFVKIGPYKDLDKSANVKKYMLSLENLAWAGTASNLLPDCEKGPGDPTNPDIKGRIMWFPPYEINFTENGTSNWESTNFIGRGEPVYTYNNSERTGTLSFKIIVDHPNQINNIGTDATDAAIDSYFAGCIDIDNKWLSKMTQDEVSQTEAKKVKETTKTSNTPEVPPAGFSVYFLNDITHIETFNGYENGDNIPVGSYMGETQTHDGKQYTNNYTDETDTGLNVKPITLDGITYKGFLDPAYQAALKKYLKEKCPHCQVIINGYASKQGFPDTNETLAKNRANNFYTWFKNNILDSTDDYLNQRKKVAINSFGDKKSKNNYPLTGTDVINRPGAKEDRRVDVSFKYVPDMKTDKEVATQNKKNDNSDNLKMSKSFKNRFYSECDFFEKLTQENELVFDTIREKIKYFHPAFHSTTPEGLNSRLTFLNQCLRQGPTFKSGGVDNLAFGRPPVCILRIGDFYYTKIIISNINFDFEPLVWDLNPEGVGVQPMIANVNMTFSYIGGSTLEGPINKLQNALSFNYYANTRVYDARADYIENQVLKPGITANTNANSKPNPANNEITPVSQTDVADVLKGSLTPISVINTNSNSSSINDNELKKVSISNIDTSNNSIKITLQINDTNGLKTGYDFKVFLTNSTNTDTTQIGVGKLNPLTLIQLFTYYNFNDKLVSGSDYSIILKFNGFNITKQFSQV